MNTSDFTYLLQHPQTLSAKQISNVRSILTDFPYFQSARAIYLKGLKDNESFKYNQELKTTAAYTTDRSVLFDFITSEEFLQNEISEQIKINDTNIKNITLNEIEDVSVRHSVIIDDALRKQIKETEPILDPKLFEVKLEEPVAFKESSSEVIEVDVNSIQSTTPEEILKIGRPLLFDKKEVHSFSEWLKITSFKPIIREEKSNTIKETTAIKKASPKDENFAAIDKFIAANPKISPIRQESSTHNIAKERMIQPESLMTETLARIYLEQKNYKKAIQAYKILSLKYPEKSGFFADQIQAVKDLQEQHK